MVQRRSHPVEQPDQDQAFPAQGTQEQRHAAGLCPKCVLADTFCRTCAALTIGISPRSVDRLIDCGELRYVGSTHRISKHAVAVYLHGSKVAGHAA